jgi:hypothetical protein
MIMTDTRPSTEEIKEALEREFGPAAVGYSQEYDFPVFTVKKESVFSIVKYL